MFSRTQILGAHGLLESALNLVAEDVKLMKDNVLGVTNVQDHLEEHLYAMPNPVPLPLLVLLQ